MQDNSPQLTSQTNESADAHENDSNDSFHTQSLESLFEQIYDQVQDSRYMLQTTKPYVICALHNRQNSKVLNEVVEFIDERVECSKPGSTCTWRQLYTITRI